MKNLALLILSLFVTTFVSRANAEWRTVVAPEIVTPDLCDYRVLVSKNLAPTVNVNYTYVSTRFTFNPAEAKDGHSVMMYFDIPKGSQEGLVHIVPIKDRNEFTDMLYNPNYKTSCSLYMDAYYSIPDKRRRNNNTAYLNFSISCGGGGEDSGVAYDFTAIYQLNPADVKLQRNC